MAEGFPRYVVDASVAAKWPLRDEPYAERALALVEDFAAGRVSLIAPDLIRDEVGSAILRAARNEKRQIPQTVEIGGTLLATFLDYELELVSTALGLMRAHHSRETRSW